MTRKASVRWTGGASDGRGAMTTESGVLKQIRYSSGAPLGRTPGTNPAELIAAAHASGFSMALAKELGAAGFVPSHDESTAINCWTYNVA
jgi:osmotically inducible protein OsmC